MRKTSATAGKVFHQLRPWQKKAISFAKFDNGEQEKPVDTGIKPRNETEKMRWDRIQLAYDGIIFSEVDAETVPHDTLYYAVKEGDPLCKLKIPKKVKYPSSCADYIFMESLRSIPGVWKMPCGGHNGCAHELIVILRIAVSGQNMVYRTWKTYCPFCLSIRVRRKAKVSGRRFFVR